eukprot:scaffold2597_cov116-Cylindrotheca_fusiformis.AAC.8
MGKGGKKSKNKKKSAAAAAAASVTDTEGGLMVDPARVRFQHSKIRPFFSGCGRSVEGTLNEIRQGTISASDLPPIQVIVGPSETVGDEPWYFSLNNRRLWVLKRCREEGLLPENRVFVRVRKPKSEQEALRYSLENCALEAKIIPEKSKQRKEDCGEKADQMLLAVTRSMKKEDPRNEDSFLIGDQRLEDEQTTNSSDDSSDDDSVGVASNRFSALF